jgi:hypothetical protein
MKRCRLAGLVFAFAVAGCSAGTVSGTGTAASHPAGPAAVITTAGARQVLAQFTSGVNQAQRTADTGVLARYVAGSSYQIRATAFKDPAIKRSPTESFDQPRFYIPFQTSYPAWFAVHAQDTYLVFAKASASARWLEVYEPAGHATVPAIATDRNGNAVPAGQLALAPDALPAAQAKYLDPPVPAASRRPCPPGTSKVVAAKLGCVVATPVPAAGTVTFSDPAEVADLHDRSVFNSHGKGELTITNHHATTSDQVYALRTTGGGALVFYDLSAAMVLSPGAGFAGLFSIDYPDLITKGKNEDASFEVDYREQFAVYEPQGTPARPQVVAQSGGAVGASCGGGHCR